MDETVFPSLGLFCVWGGPAKVPQIIVLFYILRKYRVFHYRKLTFMHNLKSINV